MLSKAANDADALRVKLHSLIMLSRFEDALPMMTAAAKHLPDVSFEEAYCLWKLNRSDEALAAVARVPNTHAALHVTALLHLRRADGAAAVEALSAVVPDLKNDKDKLLELVRPCPCSASFQAEILVESPRKLFIFIIF